jgi:hypothetical protein
MEDTKGTGYIKTFAILVIERAQKAQVILKHLPFLPLRGNKRHRLY